MSQIAAAARAVYNNPVTVTHYKTWHPVHQYDIDAFLDFAQIPPGSSVLDMACGTGQVALSAKRLGARKVVGVDIAEAMLVEARTAAASQDLAVDFIEGDMLATAAMRALSVQQAERFDYIVCFWAFMPKYIPSAVQSVVLRLWADTFLKPSGQIIIGFTGELVSSARAFSVQDPSVVRSQLNLCSDEEWEANLEALTRKTSQAGLVITRHARAYPTPPYSSAHLATVDEIASQLSATSTPSFVQRDDARRVMLMGQSGTKERPEPGSYIYDHRLYGAIGEFMNISHFAVLRRQ